MTPGVLISKAHTSDILHKRKKSVPSSFLFLLLLLLFLPVSPHPALAHSQHCQRPWTGRLRYGIQSHSEGELALETHSLKAHPEALPNFGNARLEGSHTLFSPLSSSSHVDLAVPSLPHRCRHAGNDKTVLCSCAKELLLDLTWSSQHPRR